jgi:thiamine biosynthesis protein ThiI
MISIIDMKFDHILIHYGEIALKGKNRNYFEVQLIQNIKDQLEIFSPDSFEYVNRNSGSILVKLNEAGIKNLEKVEDALIHTFGIVNFSFATSAPQDIKEIKEICWGLLKDKEFESFRITTQRSDKRFAMSSMEADRAVGDYVFEKFKRAKKVSLKNPDTQCYINIIDKHALISVKKKKGLGGMPVGSSGRALVLMSGGFDSPVAAWWIAKRGVSTRFVHFHSVPYTSKESIEKVKDLVGVLKKYKSSGKIFLVPFADAQKEIMMKCPAPLRVILYRRFMIRIAERIAQKEKVLALVTGDSIAQVASQTLENINAVNNAATMPIFRPLIGMDKEEIMLKARDIGTYDISKLPHDDCCTRLMPKSPETHAKLPPVLAAESLLNIEKMVSDALEKTELIQI